MPELPEVETVVRTLRPHMDGARLKKVLHVRPDMVEPNGFDLAAALEKRNVTNVARRAKRIVFTFDDGNRFYIHLGMTGRLTVDPPLSAPRPHTHLVVKLSNERELRFSDPRRFGAIVWLGLADHERLGPEPLTLRVGMLKRLLQTTKRPIKTALLDQHLIAGIGNIYADEALHRAKINPQKSACTIRDEAIERLNNAIKYVLRKAIDAGGSSIRDYVSANGKKGAFQNRHLVYDRKGKPCKKCGKAIERIVMSGRSTHFCKSCQK